MERKERIDKAFKYLKYKGIANTQRNIADKMKSTAQNVSSALKGDERYLTDNFLIRFNEAYNDIFSIRWLLTGEGEMLATPTSQIHQTNNNMAVGVNNGHVEGSSADIQSMVDKCHNMVEKCESTLAQMTTLVQTASQIMNNAVQLNADMLEDHKSRQELYDKMYTIQQEHIAKSREWIEGSIANIKVLREDIRTMIDEQTLDTEKYLDANAERITASCRTVNNDDIRQGINNILSVVRKYDDRTGT